MTYAINPSNNDPLSPMKILAGCRLKTKNPASPPAKAAPTYALVQSPVQWLHMPNADIATSPYPPASPSTPSMRLMALTITT